jgi:hypothetical protein
LRKSWNIVAATTLRKPKSVAEMPTIANGLEAWLEGDALSRCGNCPNETVLFRGSQ